MSSLLVNDDNYPNRIQRPRKRFITSNKYGNINEKSLSGNQIVVVEDGTFLVNDGLQYHISPIIQVQILSANNIQRIDTHPELYGVRCLSIINTEQISGMNLTHLAGIESYHSLEVLNISQLSREGGYLESINGIEFCHNLRHLGFPDQSVQDLGHLTGLRLKSLYISDNPIRTLQPVNTSCLEYLAISVDMIPLLAGRRFDALKDLIIEYGHSYQNNPTRGSMFVDPYSELRHREKQDAYRQIPILKDLLERYPGVSLQVLHWDGDDNYTTWEDNVLP